VSASDNLVLPVKSVLEETRSTRLVRLDLGGETFAFEAGQAAFIGLADHEARVPYSIASAPADAARTGLLDFLIKVEPSGRWGHQFDSIEAGARVGVRGPFGAFMLPNAPREDHFLFIAGGTGIAPIRAMIRQALLSGQTGTRMRLLYSAKTADDFAYLPELRDMAVHDGLDLRLHVTREEADGLSTPRSGVTVAKAERGRIGLAQLAPLVDNEETLCFVCGPESMVADVAPMLQGLGIDRARIRVEEW
jgi:NAD(P)H-flavin reductase